MTSVKTIVLTGGPCAGKSTALLRIHERFEGIGYKVYLIPEIATQFILSGARPWEMSPEAHLEFQTAMVRSQIAFEDGIKTQAKFQTKPVLIICDRGIVDGAAFIDSVMWHSVLEKNGLGVSGARDKRYDAVIHMVTAAKGAVEHYTLANNEARSETPEQASQADDRLINAWTGHPHFRIINNSTSFEEKVGRVLKEIAEVLGVPEPIETERKFLVKVPDVFKFPDGGQLFHIVQHYLPNERKDDSVRIRRRGQNNEWVFTHTIKRPCVTGGRIEVEKIITPGEYWRLLKENPGCPFVSKTRLCFVFQDRYFELDYFPDRKMHVLEIETTETGNIEFPKWIEYRREVTNDENFYNQNMAILHGKK